MNIRKYFGIAVVAIGIAVTVAAGGMLYWIVSADEAAVSADVRETASSTVADQWQWSNFVGSKSASDSSTVDKSGQPEMMSDDAVAAYKILQSIKLDDNGRVVPDELVKEALEEGFEDLGSDLSRDALSDLQKTIRTGLPGPAGEEAAQIFQNYYQFRLAEADFNRPESNDPVASPSSAAVRQKELKNLRRNFLGEELAERLFAVEDAQAQHMFAAIEIQQNEKLTAEEKQAKLNALQEKLLDRQLASGQLRPETIAAEKVQHLREKGASSSEIYSTRQSILGADRASELAADDREEAQWQSSFNGFWQARRYVVQSVLDETERERQISHLLDQYFSREERERARITSIDWQARESK